MAMGTVMGDWGALLGGRFRGFCNSGVGCCLLLLSPVSSKIPALFCYFFSSPRNDATCQIPVSAPCVPSANPACLGPVIACVCTSPPPSTPIIQPLPSPGPHDVPHPRRRRATARHLRVSGPRDSKITPPRRVLGGGATDGPVRPSDHSRPLAREVGTPHPGPTTDDAPPTQWGLSHSTVVRPPAALAGAMGSGIRSHGRAPVGRATATHPEEAARFVWWREPRAAPERFCAPAIDNVSHQPTRRTIKTIRAARKFPIAPARPDIDVLVFRAPKESGPVGRWPPARYHHPNPIPGEQEEHRLPVGESKSTHPPSDPKMSITTMRFGAHQNHHPLCPRHEQPSIPAQRHAPGAATVRPCIPVLGSRARSLSCRRAAGMA